MNLKSGNPASNFESEINELSLSKQSDPLPESWAALSPPVEILEELWSVCMCASWGTPSLAPHSCLPRTSPTPAGCWKRRPGWCSSCHRAKMPHESVGLSDLLIMFNSRAILAKFWKYIFYNLNLYPIQNNNWIFSYTHQVYRQYTLKMWQGRTKEWTYKGV